jgi:fibronectin-binding autotransporter adhesin
MRLRSIFGGVAVLFFCATGLRVQGQVALNWSGNGDTGSIADPVNWASGVTPTVSGTPYNATFGDVGGWTTVEINETDIIENGLSAITLNNLNFTGSTSAYLFRGNGGPTPTLEIDGTVTTVANPNTILFEDNLNLVLGASAGPFNLASGSSVEIDSAVSGAGGLGVTGSGTLTLAGAATYNGFTMVTGAATMNVVDGGSISGSAGGLIVGRSSGDTSTLAISGGGLVQSGPNATIGDFSGSSGTVTVNGDLSTLNTDAANFYVGLAGTGSLAISNGGVVDSNVAVVGDSAGSSGTVTVDGSGSDWLNSNYLYLGNSGSGSLSITNAGTVTTADANLGYYAGGSGTVTVDGTGSVWNNTNTLFVGTSGTGSVTISNGGSMTTGSAYLGFSSGGSGTLTLDTGGTATVGGGTGTLYFYAGTGTLNIGAPAGSGALAGGALNAGEVYGSGSNGTVQFNTTSTGSSPYYFTKDGTSATLPVAIGGLASVVNTAGYNVLSGGNFYSGPTVINGGTLAAGSSTAFGESSPVTVNACGTLFLNGFDNTVGSISGSSTSASISLGANTLTTGENNGSTSFAGVISGTGVLEEAGTGTLTLTNANTYSGGTKIDVGATLQLGNGGTGGSIFAGVLDNGTLSFDLSDCTTICGPITGIGGLTIEDGTVTLMGTNTYSGTTLVTDATLKDGQAAAFSPNSAMNLTNDAALSVGYNETINGLSGDCSTTVCISSGSILLTDGNNGSCSYTYAGTIMGSGALEIGSGGFQILTGSNIYSGGTTIDSGATLQIGNGGTSGSITGDVVDNGTLGFNLSNCSTFCGAICGTGGLLVESGSVTLVGTSTYSGGTTIASGATLQIGNGGTSGSITGDVVDGNTLAFDLSDCTTFCGAITGTGGITVEDGTLTLSGVSNTYSGYTLVTDATLKDGQAGAFSPNSALWLQNDASVSVGYDETVNGIKGDCGTTICISSGSTLLTDGYNGSCLYTYSGTIMGSGALEVGSGGFQILTGSNTYSGGTTIDSGATLQLGSGGSSGSIAGGVIDYGTLAFDLASCSSFSGGITGTGGIYVENGTVTLSGTNSYSGSTSVNGATLKDGAAGSFSPTSAVTLTGGSLSVGYDETIGGLGGDCSSTVCVSCGSTLTVSGGGPEYAGTIMGAGALEFSGDTLHILTGANTYSGGTTIDSGATLQLGDGGSGGSITGNVVDNGALAFSTEDCTTYAGSICGTGDVYVEAGTVTLSGSNSYSGTTYVTGATLKDGATDAFSPNSVLTLTNEASVSVNYNEIVGGLLGDCGSAVCISCGSTLLTNGVNTSTGFAGTLMGAGSLEVGQYGYLILSGSNTYSGGTTIDCMATLQIGNDGSTGSIAGDVVDNGTLAFDLSSCSTYGGTISGSGGVVVGEGTLTLSGDNSYSGGTQLLQGTTLYVTGGNSIGSGSLATSSSIGEPTTLAASGGNVTLSNGIVIGGSGLTLNFPGSPLLTLTGSIGDRDSLDALIINGPVDLESWNSYSGGTTINNTCVTVGSTSGLGTGAVTAMGSTLTFSSGTSPNLFGATFESDTVVNFNGDSAALVRLTLAESTLNFNVPSATLTDMVSDNSSSGNAINIAGDTQLTFDVSGGHETDFHGTITDDDSGTGTLVVTGGGVLNLKGANTYGGGTTVNGGLLVASAGGALGSGPVTVNGLAALGVDSGVSITNQVSLNGGSIGGFGSFDPASADTLNLQGGSMVIGGAGALSTVGGGGNQVVGTLSFGSNANLVLAGGGILEFSIMNAAGTPGSDFSQINVAGNVNITANVTDPFTIQLVGVDSSNQVIGTANTFNASQPYSWTLMSVTGITSNFNANAFVVDSSSFFSNSTYGGSFSVSDAGGDLTLNFTPVPEPSTWALMACGLFGAVGFAVRRRRRRA